MHFFTVSSDDAYMILSLLEETDILMKIMSNCKGPAPYLRLWAKKVLELKSKHQEVADLLDSIPEWDEYCE